MATPLGHSLLGLVAGRLFFPTKRVGATWFAFVIFAANAPDLDILVSLALSGDANRHHQFVSHSLVAVFSFGVLSTVAAYALGGRAALWGAAGAILYGSHLVLDMLTLDARAPFGIPLFWPFFDETFVSPIVLFKGVRHGVPGDGVSVVISNLLSFHNLKVLFVELALLLPLLVVAHVWRRRAQGR